MKREPQATTKSPWFRAPCKPLFFNELLAMKKRSRDMRLPLETGSRKLAAFRYQTMELR